MVEGTRKELLVAGDTSSNGDGLAVPPLAGAKVLATPQLDKQTDHHDSRMKHFAEQLCN